MRERGPTALCPSLNRHRAWRPGAAAALAGALTLGLAPGLMAEAHAWRGKWRGVFSAQNAALGAAVAPGRIPCKFQDRAVIWIGQLDKGQCRYADAAGKPQSRGIPEGGGGFSVIEATAGFEGFGSDGVLAREAGGLWATRGALTQRTHGVSRAICVAEGLPGGPAARDALGWIDFPVQEAPVCRTAWGTADRFRLVETRPVNSHLDLQRQWVVGARVPADLAGTFTDGYVGAEVLALVPDPAPAAAPASAPAAPASAPTSASADRSVPRFCRARTVAEKRYLRPGVWRADASPPACVFVDAVGADGAVTLGSTVDPDTYQVLTVPREARTRFSFGGPRVPGEDRPPVGHTDGRLKAGVLAAQPAYLCREAIAGGAYGVLSGDRCILIEAADAKPRVTAEFDVLSVYQRMR